MPYLFPEGAQLGADHVVLHASSRQHRVDGFAGPFSIKTVVHGTAAWNVEGRDLMLDTGSFLVLGEGDVYSMKIDSPRPVETACVFFRSGFVEAIARDAASTEALDDPGRSAPPLRRMSRLHTQDSRGIIARVQTLATRCSAALMPASLEEDLLLIARDLILLDEEVARRVDSVRAGKASTREELFRRVEAGREYMHAFAGGRLSLEDVARAACLSRFHFHRAFVDMWRKTPHEYLTAIRLSRARELLEAGLPVEATCGAVGFESVSSFSRLFRSMHGIPPGRVRRIRKTGHSTPNRLTVSSGS